METNQTVSVQQASYCQKAEYEEGIVLVVSSQRAMRDLTRNRWSCNFVRSLKRLKRETRELPIPNEIDAQTYEYVARHRIMSERNVSYVWICATSEYSATVLKIGDT